MSWLLNINSIDWVAPPTGNQSVDISYREGGTAGAFTVAGTVVFDPSGDIVGLPNPFVIAGISDAWTSIEVKSVNQCNAVEVLKTFDNPGII